MSEHAAGGRSSATPLRGNSSDSEARGCSPLDRKKPAHFPSVESGFRSIIIFLTVCTKGRRPLLANDAAAKLLVDAWIAADFWAVGRYVILPDHIHLFCAPNANPPQPLKNWISFWKNCVTRAWPNRDQVPIWQREYWDRQLRRGESYDQKWDYVENNPVRHGYATTPEAWPYHGEMNVLRWHDR
jgi:REP element-mobilizing transposase RayT